MGQTPWTLKEKVVHSGVTVHRVGDSYSFQEHRQCFHLVFYEPNDCLQANCRDVATFTSPGCRVLSTVV